MSFVVATAAGMPAADELEMTARSRRGATTVRHRDLAVAYDARSRWVSIFDDDDVLVVVDGRLHSQRGSNNPAALVRDRYRATAERFARGLLGDFVIVVLDRSRHSLAVARDPLGVRPWYRATRGRLHTGATDIATLARTSWVDTEPNRREVIGRLAAITASGGDTVYRGIETLRPGETWHLVRDDSRTLAHHRWDFAPDLDTTWCEAIEACRGLLDQVVSDRLVDGEPATSELSGGLDSSAVTGTLARMGASDLVAARLDIASPRGDERAYGDAVVQHWGLPLSSAPPTVPSLTELRALTRRLAHPVPDPNFLMFRDLDDVLVAAGRASSFTGLGGDDAFAACSEPSRVIASLQLRQWRELARVGTHLARRPRVGWRQTLRPTLYRLAPWKGPSAPGWVSAAACAEADLLARVGRRSRPVTGVAAIDERIDNLTSGYDAAILEARALVTEVTGRRSSHPFLDPRFIEATYGWNPWWPANDDHPRAFQASAYADRIPAVVARRRTKAEFSDVFWPDLLDETHLASVRGGPLRELGMLDPSGFEALVADARGGAARAAIGLSRCRSLDLWLRAFA